MGYKFTFNFLTNVMIPNMNSFSFKRNKIANCRYMFIALNMQYLLISISYTDSCLSFSYERFWLSADDVRSQAYFTFIVLEFLLDFNCTIHSESPIL